MAVYVQGTGPVPCRVADAGLQLWPDRPTKTDWPGAMNLTDRRLARVVGYDDVNGFHGSDAGIYWLSPFSQGDGYATAAESMVYWVTQHGFPLSVHYSWFLVEEGLRPETVAMLREPVKEPFSVGVCMATPGEFEKLPTPYKVGFTMYESSGPLRVYPEWRHQCNSVDRLFVPSKYCKELFSGFAAVPIDVVPLAIHEGYCKPRLRKPRDVFRVVTFATMTGRKAPLEMVEVFKKAFPRKRDVEFVIKTRLGLMGSQSPTVPDFGDERIKVEDATWSWQRVRDFLYDADCMMFLSKGEGFGMTPREAMATGCPTILADNSGMADVCDDRFNWPVPTDHMELSPLGGEWHIPDWDYAVDVLRDIYRNRNKAYRKAKRGAAWFINEHGPWEAAEHFISTVKAIKPGEYKLVTGHITATRKIAEEALCSAPSLDGTRVVEMDSYRQLPFKEVNRRAVLLKDRFMSSTYQQIQYAVKFFLSSGARAVVLLAPSVYMPYTDDLTKYWRAEELQHTLKGQTVPVLRYIADHQWLAAVVVQPRAGRMRGFGHFVDGRWKPT